MRRSGFTLLEVIVALAILAVSLVAIAGINSSAIDLHVYSKHLTIATLLARGKMAELESQLQSEGFPSDDKVEDGNFEEEGFEAFRWRAEIVRPKTEDIDPKLLVGSLGNAFSALLPQSSAGSSTANAAAGFEATPLGGMMATQLTRMLQELGKAMREVRLTILWGQGNQVDQFSITTHVVSLGQGTDRAASEKDPNAAATEGTPGAPGGPNNLFNRGILNNGPLPPLNPAGRFNRGAGGN